MDFSPPRRPFKCLFCEIYLKSCVNNPPPNLPVCKGHLWSRGWIRKPAALPSSLSRAPFSSYRPNDVSEIHLQMIKGVTAARSLSSASAGKPNNPRCLHPPPRPSDKLSPGKDRGAGAERSVSTAGIRGLGLDANPSAWTAATALTTSIQNYLTR